MKGIVFLGERELELREFPDPSPGPREVVVEIKASGMCGSDLPPYRAGREATRNIIRGHEPCGVVVERGSGVGEDEAPTGQRVMIHHYSGCGQCKYCRVGYAQLCVKGGHLVYGANANGGHGDYILVKPYMLVPLVDELSFEEGASISCGTGTAFDALRRLNVSGRDTLAIFGQGPVGLSATLLAKAMGARVIGVDMSPERLALARSFGADETLNTRETDTVQAIKDLTHGEGATTTLDCTGQPDARVNAVRSAAMWGRVCFVGEGNTATFEVSPDIIHKQLTIYGSWTFSSVGQAECARFIVDHGMRLNDLLTHHFRLDQAKEAYQLFDTQTTGKGVFVRS
ncbi:MAG TPA: zinc-binding dehydrogenase [Dehalococcoidia bacterium]|nr:zinc-binding dehydrogenase [Dehalococcoidia bacterium]